MSLYLVMLLLSSFVQTGELLFLCELVHSFVLSLFFFQAEDGIRYLIVTGVQTCALPISFQQFDEGKPEPECVLTLHGAFLFHKKGGQDSPALQGFLASGSSVSLRYSVVLNRSEERRVGKSVDLGGRRIIKKKKIYNYMIC